MTASGLFTTVQRDIILADNSWSLESPGIVAASAGTPSPAATTPNFQDSVYWLLNDAMGIGNKTFADVFANGPGTVGDALAPSGLDVSTLIGSVSPNLMAMLGLDNITLGQILTDFGLDPSTMTVDQVLNKLQLGNQTLDFFLTPLGIPSTQTTLGLAHRFSVAHLTLNEMLGRAGFSGSDTLDDMYTKFGLSGTALPSLTNLGSLIGDLGYCPTNISSSMTLDDFFGCLTLNATTSGGSDAKGHTLPTPIHLNGNTTIEQILTSQYFYDANSNHTNVIIGNWTLGQILSQNASSPIIANHPGATPFVWNTSTTLDDLMDHVHVNTNLGTDAQGVGPTLIWPFVGGSTISLNANVTSQPGNLTNVGSPINEQSPSNDNGGADVNYQGNPADNTPGTSVPNSQWLPTLGDSPFSVVLKWLNLDPNESLGDLLTNLIWVGDHRLSSATIGDVLNSLIVDPSAIGPIGSQVTDTTTIHDLLDGMGWGAMTLNDLLNLTPWP